MDDFCWVGADGALHSGSAGELMHAFLAGTLPREHPVWHQGWSEWVLLADVIAERRLEPAPDTLREPAPFSDPDATFEDVTQPLRRVSLAPPTLRSEPPPAHASLPPGGTAHTLPPPPERSAPGLRWPAMLGAGLAVIGALAATALLFTATEGAQQALGRGLIPATPSPAAAPPGLAPAYGCSTRGAPIEVSARVAPGASLHLAQAGSGRFALGVTSTAKTGYGLTLALEPLAVEQRTLLADPIQVAGIVPEGAGFYVDRFSRRVHAEEPFSLGMTPAGFSRLSDDGSQTTLWSGQASAVISRPVVARAGDAGFAVAFRRGDADSGVIRMGWLDRRGERRSELGMLSVASGVLDAPALAARAGGVLLAYAVRQPNDAPWGIELSPATTGELPAATLRFGGGDPEMDQQRPALAALPRDRWFLAWVEGDRASGRRIRGRILGADLASVGAPVELASTPSYVGSLAVHADGPELAVLFTERVRRQSEVLRAVRATCP